MNTMRLLVAVGIVMCAVCSVARPDGEKPVVNWLTVEISTDQWQFWVDKPGGVQWSLWKWTPIVDFWVCGPIPQGARLFCEWWKPDDKPWVRSSFPTSAIKAGEELHCRTSRDGMEKFAITPVGSCPFNIGYAQPGAPDTILFMGRAKFKRYHCGPDTPNCKDQWAVYADQDWKLPIGYLYSPRVYVDGAMVRDLDQSNLELALWFAQDDMKLQPMEAHLYCDGKEVVVGERKPDWWGQTTVSAPQEGERCAYNQYIFRFGGVVGMAKDPESVKEPGEYLLARHPGEYEARVMVGGVVVRTVKFTVGEDGKIVDNTAAWKAKLGVWWMPLAVAVSGKVDRAWDKAAWKTGMFWGNPLEGFEGS
jgi:hypothetical protein